jgi:hypothetical protein
MMETRPGLYAELHLKLSSSTYTNVLKPLIADIEVRFEKFPVPVYNEIRAFHDHIARCYALLETGKSESEISEYINRQVDKASGHMDRLVFDCYKFFNLALFETVIENFESKTKGLDLRLVGDGSFNSKYREYRQSIIEDLSRAKLLEASPEQNKSLEFYQKVRNTYTAFEQLIVQYDTEITEAVNRNKVKNRYSKPAAWLGSVALSGILSGVTPWEEIIRWAASLFKL